MGGCCFGERVCVCVYLFTNARGGGLSGRRGGWEDEEEEELVFGGRGFLGR